MEVFFAENPQAADKIIAQILVNKRARESAESARVSSKKKLTATLDINNTVEKFVGCRLRDPNKCELYIVEGDSALTSCKLARNAEFQAIIPVRGKTLNCLKASFDRIMKSWFDFSDDFRRAAVIAESEYTEFIKKAYYII